MKAIFEATSAPPSSSDRNLGYADHTTSLSLARALAVGCLSRIDQDLTRVNVWDPSAGSGFAGLLLREGLQTAGVKVHYRGQDINSEIVAETKQRLETSPDAEIALGDTLSQDAFEDFIADLVIVDPPWGMDWARSAQAVERRQESGAFGFGLPQRSDSTWLFISLALEKLRPADDGGGRVAALVNPGALRTGGASAEVRRNIVDAGLLESVTRLPEGLAPNSSIPVYLLTFTNSADEALQGKAMIADLQTLFTTERGRRSMPLSALQELESGLRTRKSGPRNRTVGIRQFIRRDAQLARAGSDGGRLAWRVTTYNDTDIDQRLLEARYGAEASVFVDSEARQILDLDPSRIFGDDSRELLKELDARGWPGRRLTSFLARVPEPLKDGGNEGSQATIYVPTTQDGVVSDDPTGTGSNGRVLSVQLEADQLQTSYLVAWLNSEQGVASRRRAIGASSTGEHVHALRSDPGSLMRWADELIMPVPDSATQLALATADERLGSFDAELRLQRATIWSSPESAEEVVGRFAPAFDDSLSVWLDRLPFPIASALWTAEAAASPGEQQRAYIHAWEAIVIFHATVLISVNRSDPESGTEIEARVRGALHKIGLSIDRASFGTWVVIIERISKELRNALEGGEDEVARVRRAFAGLGLVGIERLISKGVVNKFSEVNRKRNRWLGHTGYTSPEEWRAQVVSLNSDLSDLRRLLGNAWAQLLLVRAGSVRRSRDGWVQTAEVAVGTRTPFPSRDFAVGDPMLDGDLYMVKDGSESPLRLPHFVQLRSAPNSAQYTTYFYNRTEGANVRMVSYQHASENELSDSVDGFRDDFGALGGDPS